MVGGPDQATGCSFSITLGILFGRHSRQEAREGHGPAPAWAHARRGVAADGRLRVPWTRCRQLLGAARPRGAPAPLTDTNANPQADANPNAPAHADPDAGADANTHPSAHTPAHAASNPSTHKRSDVASRGRRGRGGRRPLAACRCAPGRGLSSGGGAGADRPGCERRGHGIAAGHAEPVPLDDACPAGRSRPTRHDAARHRADAALSPRASP